MGLFIFLLWWGFGVSGFLYWWTKEYDLTVTDAAFFFFAGAMVGPVAWFIGWINHGEPAKLGSKVILRRRR